MSLDASLRVQLGDFALEAELAVAAGELVAVVGPNGAGKSTLLRALAGLEPLAAGRIALDGEVLDDTAARVHVPTERRSIGFVFQSYLLFPHLSALENVAFGLRSRGVSRTDARKRAREWLDRLGMGARADARPAALSGGEAQRVALARALAIAPRLLLLDEPLAALDARSAPEVRRELSRELAAFAGTRLLVTHDPLEAMTLAQRLVVLEAGRVVQTGTPEQIARQPRSPYIAEFVGVNLYRGRASGDRVTLASGAVLAFAGAAEGEVFAVLHPRAVALHAGRPEGSPRNVWSGTVDGVEVDGQRARVRVAGALPVVAEVTPAAVSELGLAAGRTVWASCKAMEVSVYPASPM